MVSSRVPSEADIAVIGAGAAGIGAAYALRNSELSTIVLEARERVGGRAHTIQALGSIALDLGCEWLHSADVNPVVAVAEKLGLTIDRTRADWSSHVGRNFSKEDREAFSAASSRYWDALEKAAQSGGPDQPASHFLEPGNRWNPLLAAVSTYYNGVEPEQVSVIDLDRYIDTSTNWRIAEGYGTFVERAAAGLHVQFGCAARHIDHSGSRIEILTDRGAISVRAVILTLPTNVLANGMISFYPDLPAKREAAAALPLGLADKVFFAIGEGADIPAGHLYGAPDRLEAISFDLRPSGAPIVAGFLGGRFARDLERSGPAVFEAEARLQLTRMLGADVQKDLSFLCSTAWAQDRWAQGSYSHAMPGCADARTTLALPVNERLFFAGEACSRTFFSTAHGAWQTGTDAAAAAHALLLSRNFTKDTALSCS